MRSTEYLKWVKNQGEHIEQLKRHGKTPISFIESAVAPSWDRFRTFLDDAGFEAFRRYGFELPRVETDGPVQQDNPWGHPDLLDAIAGKYRFPRDGVVVTAGASLAFFLVCHAMLRRGDRVVVESPTYDPFKVAPAAVGIGPDCVDALVRTPPDYSIDFADLGRLLGEGGVKLVVLSNIYNPGGTMLSEADMDQLVPLAEEFDVTVVFDEVFRDLGPPSPDRAELLPEPAAGRSPNFISINSLSKVYGLGFLRCGWILTSPERKNRVVDSQLAVENIGSRLTQALSSRVIDAIGQFRLEAHRRVRANRRILARWLSRLPDGLLEGEPPLHGCVYFPRVVATEANSLVARLRERGVFVVPGALFAAREHIRIGFGNFRDPERLQRGLEIIGEELQSG